MSLNRLSRKRLPTRRMLALFAGLAAVSGADAEQVEVGAFSRGVLAGWQAKVFKGTTDYRLVPVNGAGALRAVSNAGASGLYRELPVDLNRTPYLNWSWRVDNTLGRIDERSKAGDDFPARVYVVVSGGLAFWKTRSLNYVWSSASPAGSHWPNAFAGDNVRMLAVRSGERDKGLWLREKRNVREDWKRFFGEVPDRIDAVALMTDTDNSGRRAVAYYGDIVFSSE